MKGHLFRGLLAAMIIFLALPLQCFASESSKTAGYDGITVEMQGKNAANVALDIPGAKGAGITAIRLCFDIVPAVPGVSFTFAKENGSVSSDVVTAYRYNENTGKLSVYAAGEKGLFAGADTDEDLLWKIGKVQIPGGTRAEVSVDTGSSDLTYGDVSSRLEEAGLTVSYPGRTESAASAETETDEESAAEVPANAVSDVQTADAAGDVGGTDEDLQDEQQEIGGISSMPVLRWCAFLAVCAAGVFCIVLVINSSRKKFERRF